MEILPNNFIIKETTDQSLLQKRLEGATNSNRDEKLMDVCKDFEGIFIHMMLKEMRKTVPDGGFMKKSTATKIFEDMFDEEISNEVSKSDEGIGLAKVIYDQFKRQNKNIY